MVELLIIAQIIGAYLGAYTANLITGEFLPLQPNEKYTEL